MLTDFRSEQSPRFGLLFGAILLTALTSSAMAEDVGDVTAGHRLAETWCANCHVVDRASKSGASTGAPTFQAIADMKSVTPMSLRVFLQTPHQRMPDLHLSGGEIDDLTAYIFSLREK
jgi:cytochrome c